MTIAINWSQSVNGENLTSTFQAKKEASRVLFAVCCLALLLWGPTSGAETLLDITQNGKELAANPDVTFYQPPTTMGKSIVLTSVSESFLFEWKLLPAASRKTLIVDITVDYAPVTLDSDPTIGLHDGSNQVGYARADNDSGSLFSREGEVVGINLPTPPMGPFGPTGFDPVDTFSMSYILADKGGDTSFEFIEGAARHTDVFTNNPINGDAELTFIWGGGTNGEQHRINSISIQVREVQSTAEALVYFPLPNCRVINTLIAPEGRLEADETRHFIVRGETTDLSSQGGLATGCDVPDTAEAVVANFWALNHGGDGRLRVAASDESLGTVEAVGTLIRYDEPDVRSYTNATVLDLCDNNSCTSDFKVQAELSESHLAVDVMGYFAPLGAIELSTINTTTTEPLTVTGDGGLELEGGDLVQNPTVPTPVGIVGTGLSAPSAMVSGRYAYAVGMNGLFTITDLLNPEAPITVSSEHFSDQPTSIFVAEPYAYITYSSFPEMKVIDISNPVVPVEIGSVFLPSAESVVVSGPNAYVVGEDLLHMILITDPTNPVLVDAIALPNAPAADVALAKGHLYITTGNSLAIYSLENGGFPEHKSDIVLPTSASQLFVADGYAYIVSESGQMVFIYDVSNPTSPVAGQTLNTTGDSILDILVSGRYVYLGTSVGFQYIDVENPQSPEPGPFVPTSGPVYSLSVAGKYAYVHSLGVFEVFELSHGEFPSLTAHSLETGQLRVRSDVITQGDLQVAGGINVGTGGILSDGSVGIGGSLEFARVDPGAPMVPGLVRLFAQDGFSGVELKAQDAAGNLTTLSPHNFSLIGEPSEPLAWSYYSENRHGKINVDMLRVVRLLEEMSGETLVHLEPMNDLGAQEETPETQTLRQQLLDLKSRIRQLERVLEETRPSLEVH